jgi:hypothetical protein
MYIEQDGIIYLFSFPLSLFEVFNNRIIQTWMDTLYPELKDYIYHYCGSFMTEDEVMAKKAISYGFNTAPELTLSLMNKEGWKADDPKVLSMITDGWEALKDSIVNRIWNEHRYELRLNLCPLCNKITRTPEARQCRFCFHDWHSSN